MENKDTFKITYSAENQAEIQNIREKYLPQTHDKMEQLRSLDASANKKATKISLIIGIIGTLIMGFGMSMLMSDFGKLFGENAFFIGIIIGVVGIAILSFAYPVYQSILKKERNRIAPEVLKLTEELMQK